MSEESKTKAAKMGEALSKIMEQATKRLASEGNIEKTRRYFLHWKGKALYSGKAHRYKLAAKRLERQMLALQQHMQRVALAKLRKNAGKNQQIAFGSNFGEKDKSLPTEKNESEAARRPPRERQVRQPVAFGSRAEPKNLSPRAPAERDAQTSGPDLDGGLPWRSAPPAAPGQKHSPPAGSREKRPALAVRRVRTPPVKVTSSLVRSSFVSPVKEPTAQAERPQQQVASLKLDLDLPCDHLTATRQKAMDRHANAEGRRRSVVGPLPTSVALPRIQTGLRGLMQSAQTMSAPNLPSAKRTL